MATLEVHDGLGRVKFIELSLDHPVLFGTSEACDVVLTGAEIRPVHGRIRWRSTRFKIEAAPDAEFVLVNGRRTTHKSLKSGDEIEVGSCRMFLQGATGGLDEGADDPDDAFDLNEGATVVLPPLLAEMLAPAPAAAQPPSAAPPGPIIPLAVPGPVASEWPVEDQPKNKKRKRKREAEPQDAVPEVFPSLFDGPDAVRLLKALSKEGKSRRSEVSAEVESPPLPLPRFRAASEAETISIAGRAADTVAYPLDGERSSDDQGAEPEKAKGPGFIRRMVGKLREPRPTAPGREKILSSPLVITLCAALVVLVGMGFWLRSVIVITVANRLFDGGIRSYEDGDFPTAIRDLDLFRTSYPEDARVGKARVYRAMANVQQYVSPTSATWTAAKSAVEELLEDVGNEPEFGSMRSDLAELVIKIGSGLADRAKATADALALAEAEKSVQLHARVKGDGAAAFLTRSPLPAKLADARAVVRKAETRAKALAAMDQALKEKSSRGVYQARDDLTNAYADLAQDRELIARMMAANELIRKGVTVDRKPRQAEKTPRAEPLGPATSLVLRSMPDGDTRNAAVPAADSVVYGLADGLAYALDARSGRPLWQRPVGLGAPFGPQPIAGDGTAICFDARTNDLCRLDAVTGELAWRIVLDERVQDAPLILGNQLYQVLPSGLLVLIALETGELQATVRVGMPLARAAVSDEAGRHLYVVGRRDCLFVISRETLECVGVEYLGHREGSVACAPLRLGRFLVVPLNDSISDGHWKVLVLDQEGVRAAPVQEIAVNGWTWQTPASSGQVVWATGDKSGFEAFAAGDYSNPAPFRSIAKLTPGAVATGPSYALALSEKELWSASGNPGKFVLDAERATIQATRALSVPGAAAGPVQTAGGQVVLSFSDTAGGGVMLMGLDPESSVVNWRTVVGSGWGTALDLSQDGKGIEAVGHDGRVVSLDVARLEQGGFVQERLPKAGELELPTGRRFRVGQGKDVISVVTSDVEPAVLWVQDGSKPGGWRSIKLPSALAAEPLVWRGHLLIPGIDTRVYLIDPATGGTAAEPFVPEYDRGRTGRWHRPALLGEESVILADDAGRVRRLGLKKGPVTRLIVEAEVMLDRGIVSDPATTGAAAILITDDGQIRSVAGRDLSPVGAWKLDAPLAGPPVGVEGEAFVTDLAGGVMAFGRDGRRSWAVNLGAAVVGRPVIAGDRVSFVTRDGTFHVRSRKDGALIEKLALGILPAGGLIVADGLTCVSSGRGSVRALLRPKATEGVR